MPTQLTVPHFAVTTLDGRHVRYTDVWQHKPLVLVVVPPTPSEAAEYIAGLGEYADAFAAHGAACVITSDAVEGLTPPSVVIADRWGEIVFTATGGFATLPDGRAIAEWLEYLERRCPECEGEAR